MWQKANWRIIRTKLWIDKEIKRFTSICAKGKIEDYILENHNGKVDGAYGSSLGGSFVGLLIQRKIINIEHGFIGGSDLDQGGKIFAEVS